MYELQLCTPLAWYDSCRARFGQRQGKAHSSDYAPSGTRCIVGALLKTEGLEHLYKCMVHWCANGRCTGWVVFDGRQLDCE